MTESEKELVRRLKERDEHAFDYFIRKNQNMVFGLSLRLLGHYQEAEDVTQEIFITVFKQIDSFRGESALSTWLYRLVVNHCKNKIKYLARRKAPSTDSDEEKRESRSEGLFSSHMAKPDELLEAKETEGMIMSALTELDEDHRTILVLRELENLSYSEIADVMKLEEGTVKSKLHRARTAFFARFKKRSEGKP